MFYGIGGLGGATRVALTGGWNYTMFRAFPAGVMRQRSEVPVIASSFRPAWFAAGGHVQTVVPALFRRVPRVTDERRRIATPDGDFLDLDFACRGARRVAILSHGLEGSSRQPYMQGMARMLVCRGWDVVAWNFRGCGGEPNRLPRSYHSGATEDLEVVVEHVCQLRLYDEVALIGFSLGGNLTLKYLGERGDAAPRGVRSAVVFSVPCDLAASSARLASWGNRIYMRRFLLTLAQKIRVKAVMFPGDFNLVGLTEMRTFAAFDDRFTGPLHGFRGAQDYWEQCSSRRFVAGIGVPTLIVNARNDPFLAPGCFPVEEARHHPWVHLEMPESGGHVGFWSGGNEREYWSELRAAEFLERVHGNATTTMPGGIKHG